MLFSFQKNGFPSKLYFYSINFQFIRTKITGQSRDYVALTIKFGE